jgi:hypothetical protein
MSFARFNVCAKAWCRFRKLGEAQNPKPRPRLCPALPLVLVAHARLHDRLRATWTSRWRADEPANSFTGMPRIFSCDALRQRLKSVFWVHCRMAGHAAHHFCAQAAEDR